MVLLLFLTGKLKDIRGDFIPTRKVHIHQQELRLELDNQLRYIWNLPVSCRFRIGLLIAFEGQLLSVEIFGLAAIIDPMLSNITDIL